MTHVTFHPSAGAGGLPDAPPAEHGRISLKMRFLGVAIAAGSVAAALELTGVLDHLSFRALADNRDWLVGRAEALGYAAPALFVLAYALCTALSLPTGLLLSTVGGFLFGTLWGGLFNVVGATLGATAIFLAARTALGNALRARAGPFLQGLEAGFRENELSYMLVLRLVPLFPFWLVNLAPALLEVRLRVFTLATAIGIVPGTVAFAVAGSGLDSVIAAEAASRTACLAAGRGACGTSLSLGSLITPQLLAALVALGLASLLPVIIKRRWNPGGA